MATLAARMTLRTTKFLGVVAVVLFVSAGTLSFWQGWLYLALNLVWLAVSGIYFLRTDPALVERRTAGEEEGEKEPIQKIVMAVLRALGVVTIVLAGLDRRLAWSQVPPALVAVGVILFFAGATLVFVVFRENTYTSSTIEVAPRQVVVVTGPYRFLRHPMYTGTLLDGARNSARPRLPCGRVSDAPRMGLS